MTTLTLSRSFNGEWLPETMVAEFSVPTTATATTMTYTSFAGYLITFRGTGLSYDDNGIPSAGLVTDVVVAKAGQTYASYTGASVDFGMAWMKLWGFAKGPFDFQNPDPDGFVQALMLRADVVNGSAFDDDIRGGAGNDTVTAGAGFDYVGDEQGADSYDGGADYDTLSFDDANYRWDAFRGIDLDAAAGTAVDSWGDTNTFRNFERYRDTLFADTLRGSAANEDFVVNRGNDVVDGRGGFDFLLYDEGARWGGLRGIRVNLATNTVIDSWKGTDTVSNIEGVRGTSFNDSFIGSVRGEIFDGGKGTDSFDGGGGVDRLVFWNVGNNNDGGHGVVIDLTKAKQVIDDGYGNAETAVNFEDVDGTRFADSITGNTAMNNLHGGEGNDTLNGGAGEDELNGEDGNDVIVAGLGNDHINGGAGNDTLTGNIGGDQFNFQGPLAQQGVDSITDFQAGIDNIWIDSAWGGGFTSDALTAAQLRAGAGLTQANTFAQRVIYNTTTGDLYFDADGKALAFTAVLFANVANQAALTFDDFNVFL